MKPRKSFAKIAFLLHLVKKINHEKRCSELLSIVNYKYNCIDSDGSTWQITASLCLPTPPLNPN